MGRNWDNSGISLGCGCFPGFLPVLRFQGVWVVHHHACTTRTILLIRPLVLAFGILLVMRELVSGL